MHSMLVLLRILDYINHHKPNEPCFLHGLGGVGQSSPPPPASTSALQHLALKSREMRRKLGLKRLPGLSVFYLLVPGTSSYQPGDALRGPGPLQPSAASARLLRPRPCADPDPSGLPPRRLTGGVKRGPGRVQGGLSWRTGNSESLDDLMTNTVWLQVVQPNSVGTPS